MTRRCPEAATVRGAESVQLMSGFEDYTSAQETKQKLLRDVFERGDAWYRNGHLTGKDAGDFFISSTASAIPSAGGAGMPHVGSRGSNYGLPGCHRAQRLRREAARHRRRRWHDSYRDGKRTRLRTPVAAGTPARSFCAPWARDHRDIQTHEGGPFARWLRSHRHQRCIFRRRREGKVRRTPSSALRAPQASKVRI
jgi:hypothetical protein